MRRFVEKNTVLRMLVAAAAAMTVFAVSCKQFTLVIDAGHGGEDGGALSGSGDRESDRPRRAG